MKSGTFARLVNMYSLPGLTKLFMHVFVNVGMCLKSAQVSTISKFSRWSYQNGGTK